MLLRIALPLLLTSWLRCDTVTVKPSISIEKPLDLALVPHRTCVTGLVADVSSAIVPVVKAVETGDHFVQPPVTVRDDRRFEAMVYIAESTLRVYEGKKFEIALFADPNQVLEEGLRLSRWPDHRLSAIVRLVRQDNAPSGCDIGTAAVRLPPLPMPNPVHRPAKIASPAPHDGGDSIGAIDKIGITRLVLLLVSLSIAVLLSAFAMLPGRAAAANNHIEAWHGAVWHWVFTTVQFLRVQVWSMWCWVTARGAGWARPIWNAKGYTGNLSQLAIYALLIPLLVGASVAAFYAEARTMVLGLDLLFGAETNPAADSSIGLMAGLLPLTSETTADAVQHAGFVSRLSGGFASLWAEKLGFLAISLAGLQGAFGIVLLWRFNGDAAVRLRLFAVLRERPLVTATFLLLDVALSLTAANRGYELSSITTNWVLPTVISATIALAIPFILSFATHYAIEISGICLGLAVTVALILALLSALAATVLSWVCICVVTVAAMSALAAIFSALCAVASGFVHFAALLGELIRHVRLSGSSPDTPAFPRVVDASLVVLILAGSGYFALRGLLL
ncbi:MAG: hypothetical protein IT168_01520 [Bryobacterales bacterium]|nr:hypothetical protein [Bryobacterales bacterium]